MPQVHEIPKEYLQRLKETGQLGVELSPENLESLRRKYKDFIQRWHDLTYQDEGGRERKRERLKRAIKDSSIKQLSENPLLFCDK